MHATELRDSLDLLLAEVSVTDICFQLDQNNIPCAQVNTPANIHEDEQVIHQKVLLETEHPIAGLMRYADTPFQFIDQEQHPAIPAATLGQHNREILEELAVSEEDIRNLEERERLNRERMADFTLSQVK